jgi:lipopolysaccharide transport system permease protein
MNAQFSEAAASIFEDRLLVKGGGEGGGRLQYEVRDRQTDTLLDAGDGVNLGVPLPDDDGDYAILVRQAAGTPKSLLFFRVIVANGSARLASQRTTSAAALRRARLTRSLAHGVIQPFRSIWRNRSLIRSMVRRDIAGRYAGSHAGIFWTVIHPLLLMLTYAFVFGLVLQTRFANDNRPSSFVLYFLAGMLPWLPFSESAGRAAGVIVEHANFVKKLVFPLDILPVNVVFAGLFSQFFGILVFFVALLLFGRDIYGTVLYLPVLIIPQLLFTLGVCWLLAALGVLFRDLGQLMGFIITVWFFLTPICYDESLLGQYHWLFQLNPFYILVRAYRAVLLEDAAPEWQSLLWLSAASALVFLLGYGWFRRTQRQFADLV